MDRVVASSCSPSTPRAARARSSAKPVEPYSAAAPSGVSSSVDAGANPCQALVA